MREYLQDKMGWLAALIFAVTMVFVGRTRLLNRYTNYTLLGLFLVSVVIVCVLHSGEKTQ